MTEALAPPSPLDGDLIDLFHREGWILEHEKPSRFTFVPGATVLEAMNEADGTQVWRNPRLVAGANGR